MVDDESPAGPVSEAEKHELLRQRYPTTHRYRGPFPKGYFKTRKPQTPPLSPEERTIKRQLKKRGLPESWAGRLASLGLKPRGHSFQTLLRELEDLQTRLEAIKKEVAEKWQEYRGVRDLMKRKLNHHVQPVMYTSPTAPSIMPSLHEAGSGCLPRSETDEERNETPLVS